MNEDLDNLIKELTDAGASDSEISAILDERLKSPQPAGGTFVDPKAQVEANKIAMGAANPLFGAAMQIPVFGDYLYSSAAKLGSTMSDQIPMGINQAAAGTIRGSYDEEALSGKYPTYSQLQGLTKADIYNKYSDANNDTVKKWIKSQVGVGSNKLGFKEILDKAYKLVGKDNPTTPELYDAIKTAYAYNKADFKNENLDQAEVQSKESQDKLTGIAQSSEDIKDVSSFASYMGDKFGQVVGLAAMFILGGIAGTYALEKGEGYDTSIKELEKSTGLNRKDLINLELDKDAEVTSEITGGINAALESASDLMVLGKLIPKGAITGFLAKFLAKNRKTAKALDIAGTAGFEGLTELIQKVDTDLGAKISAGQTLEQALSSIQWKDLKEDFYGGLAGGGAVRMATIGFDKDTENEFNNAVKDIENETKDLDAQLTTGDSELDASLDDLVAGDVKFINNINTELDGIEGGKLQEQLEAATKAAEEATSAQQSAEREALIAKKALEFNQAPVYPLSQAAGTAGPAIAQQEELRAQEAIGQQPVATPKPVEAPVDTPIVETVKEPMVSTPKPLQIKSTYEAAKYEADELHNGGKVNYFNGSNNLRKSVVEIPISELNVREEFSENKIQRLGKYKPPVYDNSATDFPVAVKQGNKLTLIDGHHRLELAKRAGEKTIKVAVKDISDKYTLVNKEKPAPPPVSKGFTTTPKRIGRKKGKEFTFGDEAGTAKGTIVKDAASIQEIYATKDDKGDVKKGGNLYGKTIEKLKENGIKTVVVGAQSPATTAVLAKMVEKGTLSIDPTGDQKVGGNTYHTRFKINSEPKVAVVKPVAKVEPKLSKKEIKEEAAKAAADPYYETPASVKEGDIFKAAKKAGEELEDKRVKLSIQLANAAKRSTKPSLKLAAFEKIAEKANELGLKDLAKEADKLATKEYDLKDQKEADKAERKELKTKREIAKPKSEEEYYAILKEQFGFS